MRGILLVVLLGVLLASVQGASSVKVLVALKQRDVGQIGTLVLEELSRPASPRYGHYLTPEDLAARIAPFAEALDQLESAFRMEGATDIERVRTGDYLRMRVPLSFWLRYETSGLPVGPMKDLVAFMSRLDGRSPLRTAHDQVESSLMWSVSHDAAMPHPQIFASKADGHLDVWVVPPRAQKVEGLVLTLRDAGDLHAHAEEFFADHAQCMPCHALARTPIGSSFFHNDFCSLLVSTSYPVCLIEKMEMASSFPVAHARQERALWALGARVKHADTWSEEGLLGRNMEGEGQVMPLEWNNAAVVDEYGPPQLKQIYQLNASAVATSSATQIVWGTGTYGYSSQDLQIFYNDYNVPSTPSHVEAVGDAGDSTGDNYVEATLDIQYLSAMAPQMQSACVNTNNASNTEGSTGFGSAFLDFAVQINNMDNPPNVISLSLGSLSWASCNIMCTQVSQMGVATYQQCLNYVQGQFQVCMYSSEDEVSRINDELMKMGSRGVTIFAASGDGGNHFSFGAFKPLPPNAAIARALNQISCNYTMPTFPAASPWVVAVGATQMVTENGGETPVGCSTKTGGGITGGTGFSWQFPMPDYQKATVQAYLQAHQSTPFGQFNASGRAYPDLSGLGHNIPIVLNGRRTTVDGTSCSTPEVAGVFSMINDARLNAGLPALGFVNQRIYEAAAQNAASMFVDITQGSSNCGIGICCPTGFVASAGWDAFTGWGNILYPGLLSLFSS